MNENSDLESESPQRAAAPLEDEIEHELVPQAPKRDPYEVLRIPGFLRYLMGGIFVAAGGQMVNVAAGWELYERTHNPFSLGLLGLMGALPVITLALPAGSLADRTDRRRIVLLGETCAATCLTLLTLVSFFKAPLPFFYAIILLMGVVGAFVGPASQSVMIGLVEREQIPAATKWGSIRWQVAATAGPVLGGALIALWHVAWPIYAFDALADLLFVLVFWPVRPRPQEKSDEKLNWASVSAGWKFIQGQPLILSTITLDMVAVLFGGATALLPVYAKDILQIGPGGLGWLRAAPAVGAIVMALALTHLPPLKRAGATLLWAIIGFGVATIVFGLSKNFALSFAALVVLGALDNISVVVRHTLLQVLTPDSMRGRVSAVNSVFIGTSNEIGELESGTVAQFFGPVLTVAGGGAITILVVILVAIGWPQVRRLGSLEAAGRENATR